MTLFRAAAAVVVAAALLPASAGAQGTPEQQQACMNDAFQYCGDYIPDETRIEACLRRNIRAISPACRAQFDPRGSRPVTPAVDLHRIY